MEREEQQQQQKIRGWFETSHLLSIKKKNQIALLGTFKKTSLLLTKAIGTCQKQVKQVQECTNKQKEEKHIPSSPTDN